MLTSSTTTPRQIDYPRKRMIDGKIPIANTATFLSTAVQAGLLKAVRKPSADRRDEQARVSLPNRILPDRYRR